LQHTFAKPLILQPNPNLGADQIRAAGRQHRISHSMHQLATLRYLPQCSPDLNPIEPSFSKVEAHVRKATERTVSGLCRRIGKIARFFSTQECANCFHAGYV
jgi:transposase